MFHKLFLKCITFRVTSAWLTYNIKFFIAGIMISIKLRIIWDPYYNFVRTLCCVTLSHCREIIYYCVAVDFVLYLGPTRINLWKKVIHNTTQCTNITHCREIIYYCVATVDFVLYLGPSRIDFWTKVIRNATKWTNIDTIWVSKKAGFFSAWSTYNIQFFYCEA